jgi:hypothetical protein
VTLVPTQAHTHRRQPSPRPPARLAAEQRRRLRATIETTSSGPVDVVLLAGSIADAVAARQAGLWTPALATQPRRRSPPAEAVAEHVGLTLHRTPDWHLDEGRSVAADEWGLPPGPRRERAARLAAACAMARRRGADRVLAGAGASAFHPAGLGPERALALVDRYGLELASPFTDPGVRQAGRRLGDALRTGRWRGRCWPGWALREVFTEPLSAAITWPMRTRVG